MKLFERELPDLPGLDFEIDASEGEERSICCSITGEKINEINETWGIDVTALVTNAIVNEAYLSISKETSRKVFSGESPEDIEDLRKFLDDDKLEGHLIANAAIGTVISDYPEFLLMPIDVLSNHGVMYLLGTFKKLKVYVDPMMRWDDQRLAIFNKSFFNFKEDKTQVVVEGTLPPKVVVKLNIKINDPESSVYLVKDKLF